MKKAKFGNIKIGKCFRLTKSGPIYMKDNHQGGQCILGKRLGQITEYLPDSREVFSAKIKISEVK